MATRAPPQGFRPPPPPPTASNNFNRSRNAPNTYYSSQQQTSQLHPSLPQRPGAFDLPSRPDSQSYHAGNPLQRRKKEAVISFTPLHPTFCSYCNLDFGTEASLNQHTKLKHVACNFCLFQAERDVLDAHVQSMHPGKLIPRTKSNEDPAEVSAWIAARRSKYPTEANIEKKKQEKQEKLGSGMLVSTKPKSLKQGETLTRNVPNSTSSNIENSSNKKRSRKDGDSDGESNGEIETDAEDDSDAERVAALTGGAVGLDDGTRSIEGLRKKKQFPCKYFAAGKCKNGDSCSFMHVKEAVILKKDRPALGGGKRRNLRSMLLESQIRRQNNLILQCIRFIVKDARFGVAPKQ
ncbi:hypothetical protein CcCBS67573_g02113 [Chytriomyces confervae]|uniref:C3H1-type domain-containing protein n=1 Tax=Chytriomyces confervae TaxID=246404 RepID=A0A507FJN7_9FUNG|nr:hypothetical protein HDU80_009357 [Chytriomyces hyalinus]TPX76641.1 hypothetical protein CcCBS67573_g02113 [Chytriomyces confervae]